MSHEQVAKAIPEQILASSVLRMSAVELAQYVCEQVAENPALTLDEVEQCPLCGTPISDSVCPLCGAAPVDLKEIPEEQEEEWTSRDTGRVESADADDEIDPFVVVASPLELVDHLKAQIRMLLADTQDLDIALFIIDALDEDGYFREDLYETAVSFNVAVPEVERVLKAAQSLDPAGIAARDVKECLLLQVQRYTDDPVAALTGRLIESSWDELAKIKLQVIAERLEVDVEDVQVCLEFMKDNLNPRPASLFRSPWSELAPSAVGQIVPDVVIRLKRDTLVVEVLDFQAGLMKLDDEYESALDGSYGCFSAEDRKHVKEFVDRARCVLDAVQLRRQTLAKIALALADYQKEFLISGPAKLKPLKQKELAAAIGVHESTVCRALNGKYVRIPSGEVVSFDMFFDSSLPIKEMIRSIIAASDGKPLSDSEIANRLAENGIQIARRTVAKYRDQLRLPSIQLRSA
jgi:RNA polymerase sigma-54 factor